MKIFVASSKFVTYKEYLEASRKSSPLNITKISNNYYMINSVKKTETSKDRYHAGIDAETAVQIASFITSYAILYMYDYKNLRVN